MIWKNYKGYSRNWALDTAFHTKEQYDQFVSSSINGLPNINIKSNKTDVVLFAQPKSASLHCHHLLSLALGLKQFEVGFNHSGGLLYYPRIAAAKFTSGGTISHCHENFDALIYQIIKNFDLKPIVLTRNLLDALVSRRDMFVRDMKQGFVPLHKFTGDAVKIFHAKDTEYQLDVIIELFARDYITFYMSWQYAAANFDLDIIFTTYEEVTQKPVDLIHKVAKWLNLNPLPSEEHISASIENIARHGGVNFNKGNSGRGADFFSEKQIERLRRLAALLACEDSNFLGFEI